MADHEDEMISVMQSNKNDASGQYNLMKKTPKAENGENELNFNENPNLGNVIKRLESKHTYDG